MRYVNHIIILILFSGAEISVFWESSSTFRALAGLCVIFYNIYVKIVDRFVNILNLHADIAIFNPMQIARIFQLMKRAGQPRPDK